MSWKRFLRSKVSKTTIWIILCVIIIGGLAFIFIDETCTFHIQRLIESPGALPTATPTEKGELLDPDEKDEVEVYNAVGASFFVHVSLARRYV